MYVPSLEGAGKLTSSLPRTTLKRGVATKSEARRGCAAMLSPPPVQGMGHVEKAVRDSGTNGI